MLTRLSGRLNNEGVEGQSDRRDLISSVQASVIATVYSADIPLTHSHFLPSLSGEGQRQEGIRMNGKDDVGCRLNHRHQMIEKSHKI